MALDDADLPDAVASVAFRRRPRRRAVISLTPLIDIVFILLIFFMLSSSFLEWRRIDLDTPAVASSRNGALEGAILVDIRANDLRLSGADVDLASMVKLLEDRLIERPERRILVRPAAGVPLQRTVVVLDRLTAIGATQVSLIRSRD